MPPAYRLIPHDGPDPFARRPTVFAAPFNADPQYPTPYQPDPVQTQLPQVYREGYGWEGADDSGPALGDYGINRVPLGRDPGMVEQRGDEPVRGVQKIVFGGEQASDPREATDAALQVAPLMLGGPQIALGGGGEAQAAPAPPKSPPGYDFYEVEDDPFNRPPQYVPIQYNPYAADLEKLQPQGIPTWSLGDTQAPPLVEPSRFPGFSDTEALNYYQPMSNLNGVPTYGG